MPQMMLIRVSPSLRCFSRHFRALSFGLVGGKGTIPTLAQFPLLNCFVVLQLLPRLLPQILQVPGMDADTTTLVRSLRAPVPWLHCWHSLAGAAEPWGEHGVPGGCRIRLCPGQGRCCMPSLGCLSLCLSDL